MVEKVVVNVLEADIYFEEVIEDDYTQQFSLREYNAKWSKDTGLHSCRVRGESPEGHRYPWVECDIEDTPVEIQDFSNSNLIKTISYE